MIRRPQLCLVWQHPPMKHGKDKVLIIISHRKAKGSQLFKHSLAIPCSFMHALCLDGKGSYILVWNGTVGPSGHKNNHIHSTTE